MLSTHAIETRSKNLPRLVIKYGFRILLNLQYNNIVILHLITLMISSDELRIVLKAETESKLAVLFKK